MTGIRTSDNCYAISNSESDCVCNAAKLDEGLLWHNRLDHMNFNELSKVSNKELVYGLP